jgi:hypothetical protein
MAIPDYPAGLPTAPTSWKVTLGRGNLESEASSGTVRSRRQFTRNVATVELALVLTLAQYATWLAFWRDTLGDGAAEFNMPVWDGHTGCPARVVKIRNRGLFEPTRLGANMQIAMALDVYGFTA